MRGIIDDSDTAEVLQERFDLVKKLLASEDEQGSENENDDENEIKVSRKKHKLTI